MSIAPGFALSGSTGTSAVYIESTAGTLRVGDIPGSLAVYFSPSIPTVAVSSVTNSINVHILSTNGTMAVNVGKVDGTIAVRVGQIDGSVAVYFSPANPAVAATFSGSLAVVPVTGSGEAIYDEVNNAIKVVNIASGTLAVNVGKIDDNVSVKFTSVAGTAGVNVGKIDGTIQTNIGKIDDYVTIKAGSASGSLAVHLLSTNGTLKISVDGATSSTLTVKLDPASAALVNAYHTANIFTTSGSYAGNSTSGGTVISPSSNASFKIFAFSLTTTAQSNIFAKFTNGSGASPTEYWRVALWAPAQGISGANLSVTPPGHLWATGVNTSLCLVLDSASLVHYSVSYIKESA